MSAEKSERPVSTGQPQTARPRAKKKSGFLAFLNCCSAQDDGDDIDMQDTSQAVKETARPQASTASQQAAQSSVPAAGASDKETGDAFHTANEDFTTTAYTDPNTTKTGGLLSSEKGPQGRVSTEQPVVSTEGTSAARPQASQPVVNSTQETRATTHTTNPGLLNTAVGTVAAGSVAEAVLASNPNVTVQAPTPVSPPDEIVEIEQAEQIISDRTPEQQALDTDIEMTDVGPSIPLSVNEVSALPGDEGEVGGQHDNAVHLPPPPPLEERQAQVSPNYPTAASRETSRQPSPAAVPRGLLPLVRPEHRGRKCLILDLDETLVHSSFKVNWLDSIMSNACAC